MRGGRKGSVEIDFLITSDLRIPSPHGPLSAVGCAVDVRGQLPTASFRHGTWENSKRALDAKEQPSLSNFRDTPDEMMKTVYSVSTPRGLPDNPARAPIIVPLRMYFGKSPFPVGAPFPQAGQEGLLPDFGNNSQENIPANYHSGQKRYIINSEKYSTCSQHVFLTFNDFLEFPPCICYMLEGSQLFHRGPEEEGIHGSPTNFHTASMHARVFFEFSRLFFWAIHQDPLSGFFRESMHVLWISQVFRGNPCNPCIFCGFSLAFLRSPCIFCGFPRFLRESIPGFSMKSMHFLWIFPGFSKGIHAFSVDFPRFFRESMHFLWIFQGFYRESIF